ncbi:hypothetical protein NSS79_15395 [Paenibacillus sp. FSL L8-0436]|uniref:hypothetical protein n=1 Tax=Paenibacillus sp. FSL L8-0436 TaxID=2954686 RepID=UPI0031585C85
MVRTAVKSYSENQKVKGILADMSAVEVQLMTRLCQIKAQGDLEMLGLSDELDNLFWRFEQRYRGVVNGKQVHAPIDFDGAEPYVLVAWKLVP